MKTCLHSIPQSTNKNIKKSKFWWQRDKASGEMFCILRHDHNQMFSTTGNLENILFLHYTSQKWTVNQTVLLCFLEFLQMVLFPLYVLPYWLSLLMPTSQAVTSRNNKPFLIHQANLSTMLSFLLYFGHHHHCQKIHYVLQLVTNFICPPFSAG